MIRLWGEFVESWGNWGSSRGLDCSKPRLATEVTTTTIRFPTVFVASPAMQ